MKYNVEVYPNRDRGYDACVSTSISGEGFTLAVLNAPSEPAARELASVWIAADRRLNGGARKTRRAKSEGELESLEAARNERDYQ